MKIPTKNFVNDPAPEGPQHAVLVDVQDIGPQDTPWGQKSMILFIWQTEAISPTTGKRFLVFKRYTAAWGRQGKPSNLRRDLGTWRGKSLADSECEELDLESLLGWNGTLHIEHNLSDGTTYANVSVITPAEKTRPKLLPVDFERKPVNQPKPPQRPVPAAAPARGFAPPMAQAPAPAGQLADPDDCPF